ncbi:MAG TPA: glycosyltransferase family 4 protein, partial [Roseiflexaceae bacterium]|nr:glycosyltransferase family 4 protein [Roseiflexaceae bacterium]
RRAARNYLIHAPLRRVDGAVALSEHERALLVQLGVPRERTVVLPNALDLDAFDISLRDIDRRPTTDDRRDVAHAGGSVHTTTGPSSPVVRPSPAAGPTVLFVGQLVPRKGFDLLARAMPAVVRARPDARFVFVTHNLQGEAELRRIAAEGGVERHLELHYRPDEAEKLRLLRAAAVVAAPSRYEGFGIMLVEAMAAGAPVITTDVPAGNEIVRHEQNGLLVPYDDASALAASIVRLLEDRALAARLAAEGRRCAEARYTADRLAADLEQWYGQIIAAAR